MLSTGLFAIATFSAKVQLFQIVDSEMPLQPLLQTLAAFENQMIESFHVLVYRDPFRAVTAIPATGA
jgi:hypothetical protein